MLAEFCENKLKVKGSRTRNPRYRKRPVNYPGKCTWFNNLHLWSKRRTILIVPRKHSNDWPMKMSLSDYWIASLRDHKIAKCNKLAQTWKSWKQRASLLSRLGNMGSRHPTNINQMGFKSAVNQLKSNKSITGLFELAVSTVRVSAILSLRFLRSQTHLPNGNPKAVKSNEVKQRTEMTRLLKQSLPSSYQRKIWRKRN